MLAVDAATLVRLEPLSTGSKPPAVVWTSWLLPLKVLPWSVTLPLRALLLRVPLVIVLASKLTPSAAVPVTFCSAPVAVSRTVDPVVRLPLIVRLPPRSARSLPVDNCRLVPLRASGESPRLPLPLYIGSVPVVPLPVMVLAAAPASFWQTRLPLASVVSTPPLVKLEQSKPLSCMLPVALKIKFLELPVAATVRLPALVKSGVVTEVVNDGLLTTDRLFVVNPPPAVPETLPVRLPLPVKLRLVLPAAAVPAAAP